MTAEEIERVEAIMSDELYLADMSDLAEFGICKDARMAWDWVQVGTDAAHHAHRYLALRHLIAEARKAERMGMLVMERDTAGNEIKVGIPFCSVCWGPVLTSGACPNGCELSVPVVPVAYDDAAIARAEKAEALVERYREALNCTDYHVKTVLGYRTEDDTAEVSGDIDQDALAELFAEVRKRAEKEEGS